MGVTQSLQNILTFESYHSLVERRSKSFYFGPQLQIYKNKFNPKQQFAKHTLKFDDIKETQIFIDQIKMLIQTKANQVPFNILYPLNVFIKDESSLINNIKATCSDKTNQVMVIHRWLGKSLQEIVNQKSNTLDEKLIWFIVNEISKSLEILEQKNHASHFLMPQNIFSNHNSNWFLYDGHYVIGTDYLDEFYRKKIKQKQLVSDDTKRKLENNAIITSYDAIQQDIFCLGYCIIFMMSCVHPKEVPQKHSERDTYINDLLQAITETQLQAEDIQHESIKITQKDIQTHKYSSELINFVRNLIKPDPKRRFSIRHIRSYLKSKQQEIFMNEELQWSRSTISKHQNSHQSLKFKKNNLLKSPQKLYQNRLLIQQSNFKLKNMTSIRTLKKQSIPQKLIMMNEKNYPKLAISLNKNQEQNNLRSKQSQTSPIKKIEQDRKTRDFVDDYETSSTIFQPKKFVQQESHSINLRKIFFAEKQSNKVNLMSAQKLSSSSINPHSTVQSLAQHSQYPKNLNTPIHSSNQMKFRSPPHYNFKSLVKVKMNYFSPQKNYF